MESEMVTHRKESGGQSVNRPQGAPRPAEWALSLEALNLTGHVNSPGHSGHCLCHLPPGLPHAVQTVPPSKRKGATDWSMARVERVELFLMLFLIIGVRKGTQQKELN